MQNYHEKDQNLNKAQVVRFFTSSDPSEIGVPESPNKVIKSFNQDMKALKVFLQNPAKGLKKSTGADDDDEDQEDEDIETDTEEEEVEEPKKSKKSPKSKNVKRRSSRRFEVDDFEDEDNLDETISALPRD